MCSPVRFIGGTQFISDDVIVKWWVPDRRERPPCRSDPRNQPNGVNVGMIQYFGVQTVTRTITLIQTERHGGRSLHCSSKFSHCRDAIHGVRGPDTIYRVPTLPRDFVRIRAEYQKAEPKSDASPAKRVASEKEGQHKFAWGECERGLGIPSHNY